MGVFPWGQPGWLESYWVGQLALSVGRANPWVCEKYCSGSGTASQCPCTTFSSPCWDYTPDPNNLREKGSTWVCGSEGGSYCVHTGESMVAEADRGGGLWCVTCYRLPDQENREGQKTLCYHSQCLPLVVWYASQWSTKVSTAYQKMHKVGIKCTKH